MASPMDRGRELKMDILWFFGFVAFYFALQLWILPRLGIET